MLRGRSPATPIVGGAVSSLTPSLRYVLDAVECPGERSGDGSLDPNGRRIGSPPGPAGCRWRLWRGDWNFELPGVGTSMTVDNRSWKFAASVDGFLLEFLRGSVGVRLGGPDCVTREARDPILLGNSIPPKLSIGPKVGAMGEMRCTGW